MRCLSLSDTLLESGFSQGPGYGGGEKDHGHAQVEGVPSERESEWCFAHGVSSERAALPGPGLIDGCLGMHKTHLPVRIEGAAQFATAI